MSEYQLTASEEPCAVIRESDGACIPPDMANTDYNSTDPFRPGYIQWKEAGGEPDPYVPPVVPEPVPTPEQTILFDHENRVRALEGQPPLTSSDFLMKTNPNYVAPAKPAAPKKEGLTPPPSSKRK